MGNPDVDHLEFKVALKGVKETVLGGAFICFVSAIRRTLCCMLRFSIWSVENPAYFAAKLTAAAAIIPLGFSSTLATTDHTATIPTAASPARPKAPTLDIRQRFQSARSRIATISSDIRQYFPGTADSAI
jgi:hypothetical protein